jgi:RAQPRD family integrative conjugative element protein
MQRFSFFPVHRLTRRFVAAVLVACATSACIGVAHADEDAEREQLARINYEIERLQAMVQEASTQAPVGARVQFRYDWLIRDLQMMRDSIGQHLEAPRQPRVVKPLAGDYRR